MPGIFLEAGVIIGLLNKVNQYPGKRCPRKLRIADSTVIGARTRLLKPNRTPTCRQAFLSDPHHLFFFPRC